MEDIPGVRGRDVIAAVQAATGLPIGDIEEIARRLREFDFFIRETRSPRSWRCAKRHAANLLVAILDGRPAFHAPKAIAAAERMLASASSLRDESIEHVKTHAELLPLTCPHTLAEAIETLINFATCYPAVAETFTLQAHTKRFIRLVMNLSDGEATLYIKQGEKATLIRYKDNQRYHEFTDLSVERAITMETIRRVGLVFHRIEQTHREEENAIALAAEDEDNDA